MSVVHKNGEANLQLRVVSKTCVARDIVEFSLESSAGQTLPIWDPGAHVDVHLPNGISRQYSLMRGSTPDTWKIAVLVENGGRGGSRYLGEQVNVGSVLEVVGPRNHFPLEPADSYLFIAGGIGVTPLIPMLESCESKQLPWNLIYLGRSIETMAYAQALEVLFPGKVQLVPKDTYGPLDIPSAINQVSSETHVYTCGPERLLVDLERALNNSPERLHLERFHPRDLGTVKPNQAFKVFCQKSDIELLVEADESILMAADFAGIDIPGDCMEGTCGACETKVLAGVVEHRDSVLSSQERLKSEKIMICVSRSVGDRLVIDL